jgi:hypothetical protein
MFEDILKDIITSEIGMKLIIILSLAGICSILGIFINIAIKNYIYDTILDKVSLNVKTIIMRIIAILISCILSLLFALSFSKFLNSNIYDTIYNISIMWLVSWSIAEFCYSVVLKNLFVLSEASVLSSKSLREKANNKLLDEQLNGLIILEKIKEIDNEGTITSNLKK